MKLDEWLTRLVAVPPGRNPLASGIAIGTDRALHPRPFGHYRRNRDPFSAPMSVSNCQAKSRFDSNLTGSEVILGPTHSENNYMYYDFYVKRLML
jgi:hypothetical protein